MPRLASTHKDRRTKAGLKTHKEYWFTQKYANGTLTIEGGRTLRTRKGTTYLLHIVDGKFDHFHQVPKEELKNWDLDDYVDPRDWCRACIDAEKTETD